MKPGKWYAEWTVSQAPTAPWPALPVFGKQSCTYSSGSIVGFTMKDYTVFSTKIIVKQAYKGEWSVEVPPQIWNEVIPWCKTAFGPDGRNRKFYRWRCSYSATKYKIFLRYEEDLTMFRLKWYDATTT